MNSPLHSKSLVEVFAQVAELWIHYANQSELLLAAPALDLLFATDSVAYVAVRFEENKAGNTVLCCETLIDVLFVLDYAALEMIRDTGVKHTGCAGKDIDMVYSHGR